MDNKFTESVQAWLDTPEAERDWAKGAVYFLQLSGNRILYHNMVMNIGRYKETIEYQIRKYMKFRLAQLTHEQVEDMAAKVDRIVAEHFPDISKVGMNEVNETSTAVVASGASSESGEGTEGFTAGKRSDHDSLPLEIQALYVENLSILQQMRELHLQLRKLSTENATCPDSERYPFLKELISLDKKYHENWDVYDHYAGENLSGDGTVAAAVEDSSVDEARKIARRIALLKGKYKKNPTDELKEKIVSLYAQLEVPEEKMTAELKLLGIIE